jgi:hypothetical protein
MLLIRTSLPQSNKLLPPLLVVTKLVTGLLVLVLLL